MIDKTRIAVRDRYASIARGQSHGSQGCCGESAASSGCCGSASPCCGDSGHEQSEAVGYDSADLHSIPAEADLGLGCGNPTALARIKPGETVVDLGSGGGIDCFLAAGKVGDNGKVIGVDMTPDMIDRARQAGGEYRNVEFRLGEIEHLPVADNVADVIISNCVINLSPEKPLVFAEAWRVLKKGGRLQLSDIVLLDDLPEEALENEELLTACVAGASRKEDYLGMIRDAGFTDVTVEGERVFAGSGDWISDTLVEQIGLSAEKAKAAAASIASIEIIAVK